MGATTIHHRVPKDRHERAIDAYRELVEEALYEYGHDPYSGTIATCEYYGRIDTPKNDEEYEEALDKIGKRECVYYIEDDYYVFIGWASC
jgi:FMN phosphatase YigB (HAD superfamily)